MTHPDLIEETTDWSKVAMSATCACGQPASPLWGRVVHPAGGHAICCSKECAQAFLAAPPLDRSERSE